jgi:hypothetical protein
MSVLNGELLDLPSGSADAIADKLRERGHTVERTDLDITWTQVGGSMKAIRKHLDWIQESPDAAVGREPSDIAGGVT